MDDGSKDRPLQSVSDSDIVPRQRCEERNEKQDEPPGSIKVGNQCRRIRGDDTSSFSQSSRSKFKFGKDARHIGGYLLSARGGYGQSDPREETFRARGDAGALEANRPREFQGQCDRYAGCGRAVDGASGGGGRIAGQGEIAGAAARNAGRPEGFARDGRDAHHLRLAIASRFSSSV